MTSNGDSRSRRVVEEHLAAFNAHDSARVLATFTSDATWTTGQDTVRGTAALTELFDPWLWTLDPVLEPRTVVVQGDVVAAELVERLTVDGERRTMPIALFVRVTNDRIAAGKVYREGSADLD